MHARSPSPYFTSSQTITYFTFVNLSADINELSSRRKNWRAMIANHLSGTAVPTGATRTDSAKSRGRATYPGSSCDMTILKAFSIMCAAWPAEQGAREFISCVTRRGLTEELVPGKLPSGTLELRGFASMVA